MSSIPKPLIYDPPLDPLKIIHQDDDLLVLSKPDGLLSVPGKGAHLADCMEARARTQFPDALLVHRLDMDTSGLFIMAMNKKAQIHLGQQFERRKIDKTYIARVSGHPEENQGFIDLPLRCDWPNRPMQMVCYDHGKPSQTHWRVIAREQDYRNEQAENQAPAETALIELKPVTGRSHQLRVHLQALGFPILGDMLYAPYEVEKTSHRMELHAQDITLYHPTSNDRLSFSDPCPF